MLPKRITLNTVKKPFTSGHLYVAAFEGNETTGPFGSGENPTDAVNNLVDVTEEMISEEAA